MHRLYDGGAGIAGNGGATKKTAARAGMTLQFAIAGFHGVAGVFAYRAIDMRMDTAMDVDAVLESYIGNAMMIVSQAAGQRTASRKRQRDRGQNYANSIERNQGCRAVKAPSGNQPAQHARFTLWIRLGSKRSSNQLKRRNEAKQRFSVRSLLNDRVHVAAVEGSALDRRGHAGAAKRFLTRHIATTGLKGWTRGNKTVGITAHWGAITVTHAVATAIAVAKAPAAMAMMMMMMIVVAPPAPTTVMTDVAPSAVTMAPTASVLISVTAVGPAPMIVSGRRRYETNSRSKC